MNPVTLALHDHVATVTMADPARRNALGETMLSGLVASLADAEAARARVVVLRASEGPVWCAGFDIGALRHGFDPLADDGPLKGLFAAVAAFPGPVIAMLNGSAWGGGTDLALRCDIAIGCPAATLAFTPARLGLPYDPDGLQNVLRRCGLALAIEMFATAAPVSAERALAAGLLNHVVPEAELEAFTLAMAHQIAANAPLSVASAKATLRALNADRPAMPPHAEATRQQALNSADFAEGLAAFAAKRRPVFEGR